MNNAARSAEEEGSAGGAEERNEARGANTHPVDSDPEPNATDLKRTQFRFHMHLQQKSAAAWRTSRDYRGCARARAIAEC